MTGVDFNGDGAIDMDTEGTHNQLSRLRTVKEELDTAWVGADAALAAHGVGSGPLGQAFKDTVVVAAGLVKKGGQFIPTYYTNYVNVGDEAVTIYREGGAAATARLGGGTGS